jgi:hypothetical protein
VPSLALYENTADQLDPGIFTQHVRKEIFEDAMRAARDSQYLENLVLVI